MTDSNKTFQSRSRGSLIDSDSNSWLGATTPGDSGSHSAPLPVASLSGGMTAWRVHNTYGGPQNTLCGRRDAFVGMLTRGRQHISRGRHNALERRKGGRHSDRAVPILWWAVSSIFLGSRAPLQDFMVPSIGATTTSEGGMMTGGWQHIFRGRQYSYGCRQDDFQGLHDTFG